MIEEHHIRIVRRARYYTISSPAPVTDIWMVCHGYGQLAGRFIQNFQTIAKPGRLIVAPEGLHRYYRDPLQMPAKDRRVGASWMTREDRENDIADYVDFLDQLISELVSRSPSARLWVLGFSQGSATVFRWAVRASRVPDVLIMWAGEVPTDIDWSMGARKLVNTRIVAVRGTRDEMTPQASLDRNLAVLADAGLGYKLHQFDGSHEMDEALLRQLAGD